MILSHFATWSWVSFIFLIWWDVFGFSLEVKKTANWIKKRMIIATIKLRVMMTLLIAWILMITVCNRGSMQMASSWNRTILNTFLLFTGYLRLLPQLGTETTLVLPLLSMYSLSSLSFWAWLSSLSLWDQLTVFSTPPILSKTWLKKNLTPSICGLRKLRNRISHIISSQLSITILESMLSKPLCMTLTWSLKSSNFINKLHQRCKLKSFRTLDFSRSLKKVSTTFSTSVKEDSQTN